MVTGRGAWTHIGGTTPYYALVKPKVGSQVVSNPYLDPQSYDYRAVHYGVIAIQARLKELGFRKAEPNGVYDWWTQYRVKQFQKSVGLTPDGQVGPETAKRLFRPVVVAMQAKYGIPANLLGGIMTIESIVDPGAVGYSTPGDKGLLQFNTVSPNNSTWWNVEPADYTPADAFDYKWAIEEGAKRLAWARKRYAGKGTTLQRKCMVAQHNSPLWADEWFKNGVAPNATIKDYVTKALAASSTF